MSLGPGLQSQDSVVGCWTIIHVHQWGKICDAVIIRVQDPVHFFRSEVLRFLRLGGVDGWLWNGMERIVSVSAIRTRTSQINQIRRWHNQEHRSPVGR